MSIDNETKHDYCGHDEVPTSFLLWMYIIFGATADLLFVNELWFVDELIILLKRYYMRDAAFTATVEMCERKNKKIKFRGM
uniref:Uncharacterized protein n=1 Tax=Romanomermis culicivorax TaxID=13658 RepID=A0A915IMJ2_ROMCU